MSTNRFTPSGPAAEHAFRPSSARRHNSARDDQKLVLTVPEIAAVLGISRSLAYELVGRGDLPSIRLGRRIVVPRRAIEEMLDAAVDLTT